MMITKIKAAAFERYLSIHTELFQNTLEPLIEVPLLHPGWSHRRQLQQSTRSMAAITLPSRRRAICLNRLQRQARSKRGRAGLSEVLFSVTGDTDTTKAKLLLNMWNHTDSYATDTTNLFTSSRLILQNQ
jgi:hypothetical protein